MLSLIQQRKLTRLFRVHDLDGNGYVERMDYERLVDSVGRRRGWAADSTERAALRSRVLSQWAAICGAADPPGSGRVDLEGWLALWNSILQAAYEERVRGVAELLWETMDGDGDGRITREESHLWFEAYGLTADDAERTFTRCDRDGSGFVTRDEWLAQIDQFFLSMDPADPGNLFFGPLDGGAA